MEKVPNEILEQLIGYVDKKSLLSVRLINKTWQTYAEDCLRKLAYVSLEIDEDVSDLIRITSWRNQNTIPPLPLFIKFKISGVLSKAIVEEFGKKYGNVIQSLKYEVKKVRPEGYPQYPTPDHNNIFELLMKTPNINEIYINNYWKDVEIKHEYQLCLPKLRILELARMNTNFVKLILDSSPNIQQVKLGEPGIGEITEDNWRDYMTIFQSIATRGIELKLRICISTYAVNLQRLKEISKIPLNVTGLILIVHNYNWVTEERSLVQESIEELIHIHSKTLKLLVVRLICYTSPLWKLYLKNLDNLEQLKLFSSNRKEIKLQVNLGQVPMLKKVVNESVELNMESAPLLKHLSIAGNNAFEYLKRLLLFDISVRLDKLCLNFKEETLTTTEADERIQLLNKFLLSQAKNLKVLEIGTKKSTRMNNRNELQFPIMENLQKLILLNLNGQLKLEQFKFPHLKLLKLDTRFCLNPSLNGCLESVHTLILKSDSFLNFKNTVIRFPRLKNLHLEEIVGGILPFVFKNLTHLEELKIGSEYEVTWNELTGYSKDFDFNGEPSTRNLNTSIPNLGDLIDLKRLHIGKAWIGYEVKAVSYLISCGKLKNLKYFEACLNRFGTCQRLGDSEQQQLNSYVKIIESNNTRTNMTPFPNEMKM